MQTYLYRLVGILLLSTNAFAEPTETIKVLMKLRASMFDLGIVRLETDLGKSVTYQPDSNRISILAPLDIEGYSNSAELERACKEEMARIRVRLGVNPEDGKTFFGKNSIAGSYFVPPSMGSQPMSDAAKQEVDNIVEVSCFGRVRGIEGQGVYQCKSMLRSVDILCGQK